MNVSNAPMQFLPLRY